MDIADHTRGWRGARSRLLGMGREASQARTGTQTEKDKTLLRRGLKGFDGLAKWMKQIHAKKDRHQQNMERKADTRRRATDAIRRRISFFMLRRLEGIENQLQRGKSLGLGMLSSLGSLLMGGLRRFVFSPLWRLAKTLGQLLLLKPLMGMGGGVMKAGRWALGGAKKLGTKFMQSRAGAMLGAGANTARAVALGGLTKLKNMGSLTAYVVRSQAPAIARSIGGMATRILGPLIGGPAGILVSVATAGKLIWDHLLPESWKWKLKATAARTYLYLIDKVSGMMESFVGFFSDIGDWFSQKYETIKGAISSGFDWWDNLDLGQVAGDAWAGAKDKFSLMMERFFGVFYSMYDNFVAPFIDPETGKFSMMRGLKSIGNKVKGWYDGAVEATSSAIETVDNVRKGAVETVVNAAESVAKLDPVKAAQEVVEEDNRRKLEDKRKRAKSGYKGQSWEVLEDGQYEYAGKRYVKEAELYQAIDSNLKQIEAKKKAKESSLDRIFGISRSEMAGLNPLQQLFKAMGAAGSEKLLNPEAYTEEVPESNVQKPMTGSEKAIQQQSSGGAGASIPAHGGSVLDRPNLSLTHVNATPVVT